MILLIDLNANQGDFFLDDGFLYLACQGAQALGMELLVTENSIEDLLQQYSRRLQQVQADFGKAVASLGQLTRQQFANTVTAEWVGSASLHYQYDMDNLLSKKGFRKLPCLPYLDLRAVGNLLPMPGKLFDGSSRALRHLTVWQALKQRLSEQQGTGRVDVVTPFGRDFCAAGGQLRPELAAYLTESVSTAVEVRFFENPAHWAAAVFLPACAAAPVPSGGLKKIFPSLGEMLQQEVEMRLTNREWSPADLGLEAYCENPVLKNLSPDIAFQVEFDSPLVLPNGQWHLSFRVNAACTVDYFVYRPNFEALRDAQRPNRWDDHYSPNYLACSTEMPIAFSGMACVDKSSGALMALSVSPAGKAPEAPSAFAEIG